MTKNKTNWKPKKGEIVYAYDFEHELLNPDIDCRKKFIFKKNGLYRVSELDYENIFGLHKYKHIRQRRENDYAKVYKFLKGTEFLNFEIYEFNNSDISSDDILQQVDYYLYINGSKYDKINTWSYSEKSTTSFEIAVNTIGGEKFIFLCTSLRINKTELK